MRLGWYIPLPGPFGVGGTIWRSKRRRPRRKVYHGEVFDGDGRTVWRCAHNHTREDTADACGKAEYRRRVRVLVKDR